jgi:hypothetical protein
VLVVCAVYLQFPLVTRFMGIWLLASTGQLSRNAVRANCVETHMFAWHVCHRLGDMSHACLIVMPSKLQEIILHAHTFIIQGSHAGRNPSHMQVSIYNICEDQLIMLSTVFLTRKLWTGSAGFIKSVFLTKSCIHDVSYKRMLGTWRCHLHVLTYSTSCWWRGDYLSIAPLYRLNVKCHCAWFRRVFCSSRWDYSFA